VFDDVPLQGFICMSVEIKVVQGLPLFLDNVISNHETFKKAEKSSL